MTLPEPELAPYSPAQIAFAVAAWPLRAAEELRSALVFRALAAAGRAASLPARWLRRFAAAVHDEVGHARLCATVGASLGADLPRYDATPVHGRLAVLPEPRARALALLLVEVAIGETISMSLFRAGRRAAVEPLTRAALETIVRDEARHQRLGWDALRAVWPGLAEQERGRLQTAAREGLGALEQQIALPALRWLEAGRPFDAAHAALGVLPPEARVEAFYRAVEDLVLPRLDALGLDGAAAWSGRYRTPPTASSGVAG
jgi:hypothetical protein